MLVSEQKTAQTYSQEEIQQILHLAIARQETGGEFSRQQLEEIAGELGINPQCIQAAERDWLQQQYLNEEKLAFNSYRREIIKYQGVKYLIFNTFLISIDFLGGGDLSWSLYILLIWGLKLSFDSWKAFQERGEAYERDFKSWKFKKEIQSNLSNFWQSLKEVFLNWR